jgi:hypothetical protein
MPLLAFAVPSDEEDSSGSGNGESASGCEDGGDCRSTGRSNSSSSSSKGASSNRGASNSDHKDPPSTSAASRVSVLALANYKVPDTFNNEGPTGCGPPPNFKQQGLATLKRNLDDKI